MPMAAMVPAGPTARPSGMRCRRSLRKRGRLAFGRAPGQVEFALQSLVLALQSVALALQANPIPFRALEVTAQPLVLALQITRRLRAVGHADVMPDS